ncbi:hypothetical protein WICMUC_002207 [Wickerhamomyces mucosus]|uniref:Uncharacterized protein n=1 Tax=Wickerhamomyces mucosus TaxID=1378264 RepID=A0A9P8PRE8_9ASCO|nr:hypothetical protein WICMUC_002207 [Wickerhamomyces mucosus]
MSRENNILNDDQLQQLVQDREAETQELVEEIAQEITDELVELEQEFNDYESTLVTKQKFSITQFLGSLSINLILPFINGLMLGFGELVAHEIGFHYNWIGANVSYIESLSHKQHIY